jgi:hypothetical protein
MFHYDVALAHRGEYGTSGQESKAVFVGVVLHRSRWHVTVKTEAQELLSGTLPGHWEALRSLLDRHQAHCGHGALGGAAGWVPFQKGRAACGRAVIHLSVRVIGRLRFQDCQPRIGYLGLIACGFVDENHG